LPISRFGNSVSELLSGVQVKGVVIRALENR
jgi:hypothetical protein